MNIEFKSPTMFYFDKKINFQQDSEFRYKIIEMISSWLVEWQYFWTRKK